jgi:pyruvate/2-oxoglutarate dehydrogenase complex dihydrolipoamide dehydrogenase (E3) component
MIAEARRPGEGRMAKAALAPWDRELLDNAQPAGWQNPPAGGRYNLVVVGAGTAGLVCAAGAAGLGARVALVERGRLGGDCLNYGCVPSKALLRCARAAAEARRAAEFGVRVPGPVEVDFAAVMERMRRLRAGLSRHDSAARFRGLGVDVFLGEARFSGPDAVAVGGQALRFARAVIATGTRPAPLELPGLGPEDYLTNETVFDLEELPRRLVVVGAGPVGCELGQAFRRFGSDVTLVNRSPGLLGKEGPDAVALVRSRLEAEGVRLELGAQPVGVECAAGGLVLLVEKAGRTVRLPADALLAAVGRRPNVEGLGLEEAGVEYDAAGVKVNDFLQTTNPHVYAAGDVCSPYKFTHAADAMARLVLRNALFFGRARVSKLVIPWCTYTDPEVAHVGLTAEEAGRRGVAIQTFKIDLSEVDRAVLDGAADGFAVAHVRKGSDRIVGATIVAAHAGEMVGEVAMAMAKGLGLAALSQAVHPYPTQAEVLRRLGDAWQKTRLTPRRAALLRALLRWRR